MKVTNIVVCSLNPAHKFPVVYEVEPHSEFETSFSTEFCPFCGASVQVTIRGKIENEELIRKLEFDVSDDEPEN